MPSLLAKLHALIVPPESRTAPGVFAQQVRLLYEGQHIALTVAAVVGLLLVLGIKPYHPGWAPYAWLGVFLAINAARFLLVLAFQRVERPERTITAQFDALGWYRRFMAGALAAGAWWGASALWFFLPGVPENQLLIALVLAGICSGGMGTLAPRREAALAFLSLVLLPFAARLLFAGDEASHQLLVLVVLFYLGMLMVARRIFRTLVEVLGLRQQRDAYADALRALHIITADDATVMPGKVDRMLDLGLQVFGLDRAMVARVAGEALVVEHARGALAHEVLGRMVPVAETPCFATLQNGEPRAFEARSGVDVRAFDHRFRAPAYLGCALSVGGRRWGTVSFAGAGPRFPFGDTDLSLMHLFAQWIGAELAREQTLGALVAEKNRFEALFNGLPDPVIVTDADLRITTVNPAFERVFGYGGPEVVGRTPRFLFADPVQYEQAESQLREGFRHGLRRVVDVSLRAHEGSPVEAELNARLLRDPHGGPVSVLVHAHDVTERKRVSRMKDQFISTVSHELRTPLTAINGAVKLIHATQRGALNETALGLLEIADRNGERLLRLVNDILDLERAAAGRLKFDLRELRVADVVDGALRSIQPFAGELDVGFELIGDPSPWVRADPQRLEQVLLNLLSNAVKYSPPGATVQIRISTSPERVRIAVADHGPGIPPEFQPRLFEHFSQWQDGKARRQGGSGLGLSIAKALTEQMGGWIGFESELGRGSCFHVEMVRVPPQGIAIDPNGMREGLKLH